MKTLELEVDEINSPSALVEYFNANNMEEGDTLKIMTEEQEKMLIWAVIAVAAIAIVYYFISKKQYEEDGDNMLADIFKGKSVEEIEKQIEEEYGVKVEVEQREDEERREWGMLAMRGLSHAYGDDEPEYFDADIKEPNPEYKAWKKEK
ncbi:MAG: hypothetical protein K1X63_01670 [Chitinophagales bacterium]|nr:hypothetical protein [Chitinophagales bacterium]